MENRSRQGRFSPEATTSLPEIQAVFATHRIREMKYRHQPKRVDADTYSYRRGDARCREGNKLTR
ncbi:hypothetical protein [Gulosibacter bifidus]|uniref:Transposase n=1 Tax=Gulosibacter bifidus TaxID=272239 RepID=A0ABW5RKK2_9MICO